MDPIPIGIGDVLQFTFYCWSTSIAQLGVNVLHYTVDDLVGSVYTLNNTTFGMDALAAPLFKACMPDTASYYGIDGRRISTPKAGPIQRASNQGPGTFDTLPLAPTQSRGLISKRGVGMTRSSKGRMYVPFPSTGAVAAGGAATGPYHDAITALGDALLNNPVTLTSGGSSVTLVPVVLSRKTPTTFQKLFGHVARGYFATQRRSGHYGRTNALPF